VKKSFNIQEPVHLKSKRHATKPIQLRFILIFSEEIIQYSKKFAPQVQMSWNQAYSATIYFNFSEEIIQYSRTFAPQVQTAWNQDHSPLLVENFPNTPRTQSEASWFSRSHNYKTKQTTFLHR